MCMGCSIGEALGSAELAPTAHGGCSVTKADHTPRVIVVDGRAARWIRGKGAKRTSKSTEKDKTGKVGGPLTFSVLRQCAADCTLSTAVPSVGTVDLPG